MKKQIVVFSSLMMAIALIIGVVSCNKDDDKTTFALSSLKSGSVDLNGATSPSNVPVDQPIIATFNLDVKTSTANTTNITMIRDYDDAAIDLTITVSGASITITPNETLGNGALFELKMTGIQASDDQSLSAVTRTFTTEGTFVPSGQIAHWGFEDNADDDIGTWDPAASGIVDITYFNSRNTAAGKAASFNGTTSIIEVPNGDQLIDTHDFTISFWVKTYSAGKTSGHFVLGLGAFYGIQYEIYGGYDGAKFGIQYEAGDGTTTNEDMWFPSLATDNTNGGWQGWDYAKSLTADEMIAKLKDTWLQVVYTFNGASKKGTLYYNGEKMKSFDFNLWPDGDIKKTIVGLKYGGVEPEEYNILAFGFVKSRNSTLWNGETWGNYDNPEANHFKGLLDDVRIFHKPLTAQEVDLMYQSEKP